MIAIHSGRRRGRRPMPGGRLPLVAASLAGAALLAACGTSSDETTFLAADVPLHLEDHLDAARLVDVAVPEGLLGPVTWTFEASAAGWEPVPNAAGGAPELSVVDGALRIVIDEDARLPGGEGYVGAVSVALPDWTRSEWAEVLFDARTTGVEWTNVGFNLGAPKDAEPGAPPAVLFRGEDSIVVRDGQVHAYRLRADWSAPDFGEWKDPWSRLVLEFWSIAPATVDLVSVRAVPKVAHYEKPVGAEVLLRGDSYRRVLYMHAPGRVELPVKVPRSGRLDVGLGVLQASRPVTFRVTAATDGGEPRVLLEERVEEERDLLPRTVDLASLAGREVTLGLETEAEVPAGVAFWAAPVLSGEPSGKHPNVIFYVIDGGGADYMSVYGHERPTTPNLERIAAEGVVFEHAYSNAAWTKPSTASFMTSLHQLVLGGFHSLHDAIPDKATTMAEHFHRAGYQNAVFTSNPWAGSASNLQRGTDLFRDRPVRHHSTSSEELQAAFWEWRDEYPGTPYWVHFQTTDVHEPHQPEKPFAGLFVDDARRERFEAWWKLVAPWEANVADSVRQVKNPESSLSELYRQRLARQGIDPRAFFAIQQGLYEECMAHQDHELGLLVDELKARGEWESTILVIAADHGHPAGSFSRFGRELLDPLPPKEEGALLDAHRTRVPLIVVWPGHLAAGARIAERVSMIDVLPTLLDLAGLPPPEIAQGQSLAPLLRGEPGWIPRPVVFEQLQPAPDQHELVGHIEVIDGRWGASLEIWPASLEGQAVRPVGHQRAARPHLPGRPRLLLYDVESDPLATRNVNDEHPDLVEKYTAFLEHQWEAHRELAKQFEPGEQVALTPDQLETLRALGYIQ